MTDGTRVFAYFGSEGVFAYDFGGKLLWKVDIGDIKTLGMGTASSPVLYKNLVILQCDEDSGDTSFITALDAQDRQDGVEDEAADLGDLDDAGARDRAARGEELVAAGNEFVIGYDPATGKELWRTKGLESNTIATPLVGHGLVIVSAGYPTKKVHRDPAGRPRRRHRHRHVAWTYEKGTSYIPSPILYGDYVYLISRRRAADLPRREDRRGEVRRRASAGAGQVHRLAGGVRRQPVSDQHRRRHVRGEGRPDARSGAHQRARRAGLRLARAGRRAAC